MGDSTVIIVTGTSRGIGASIVSLLLATKKPLSIVTVSRSPGPSGPIVLPDGTVHALTHLQLDLGTPSGPIQVVKRTIETYGKLDGLVVNHGVLGPMELIAPPNTSNLEVEEAEISASIQKWKASFDVNFFSAVTLVKAAVPYLRRAAGRVVLVSSGASTDAYPRLATYSASKAAINALCRSLGVEEPVITSVCVEPGVVDTEMHHEVMSHQTNITLQPLKPDQPGSVIANLVLRSTKQLSGGYYSWNASDLQGYQGPVQ